MRSTIISKPDPSDNALMQKLTNTMEVYGCGYCEISKTLEKVLLILDEQNKRGVKRDKEEDKSKSKVTNQNFGLWTQISIIFQLPVIREGLIRQKEIVNFSPDPISQKSSNSFQYSKSQYFFSINLLDGRIVKLGSRSV